MPAGVTVFARDEVAIRRFGEAGDTGPKGIATVIFAAMELPDVWAKDVAAFFGSLRP